jgi:hypothetical protein
MSQDVLLELGDLRALALDPPKGVVIQLKQPASLPVPT